MAGHDRAGFELTGGFNPPSSPVHSIVTPQPPQPLGSCCVADPPCSFFTIRTLWQGRAGQGRAGQGRAGQGRAGQGRAGQGCMRLEGRAEQGRTGQGKTEVVCAEY